MNGDTVLSLIFQAGPVVKLVLLILLFFSVYSWAIIIHKHRLLSKVEKETEVFNNLMQNRDWDSLNQAIDRLSQSPVAKIFKAAHAAKERSWQDVKRALKRVETAEAVRLEKHLTFLATTGSSTPFIGLFGTVWGIMNAFRGIGRIGSASLAVVAPGIAEALIATAAGLVAAIPAAIAYNYYLSRAQRNIIIMEDFSQEMIDHFARKDEEAKTGPVGD
jgi:biopolymer transport protein TolQ